MVLYGPLKSLRPSTRKGLSNRSKDELFRNPGLHIAYCSPGENSLIDDKEDMGDESPWFDRDGSANLQYIADMHLIMSSESRLGVSGTWSEMQVPRCSARLIILEETFCAYCEEETSDLVPYENASKTLMQKATSIMDTGWEWQARRVLSNDTTEADALSKEAAFDVVSDDWER